MTYQLTKKDFRDYLTFLKEITAISDKISMDYFYKQTDMNISVKNDGSFVTEADKQIEDHLRNSIFDKFPDHSILGEEQGETISSNNDYRWIIDPIDGTHGFMRGLPIWATLIALEHSGEIIVSMISAPALNSKWWAGIGHGSYKSLNGEEFRINTSNINSLKDSQMLYTGIKECGEKWSGFDKILDSVWRERGVGDFWGHCLIAEGASEIMLDPIVNIWDVASLYLLVREANGIMSDEKGDLKYSSGHAISSNKHIHEEVINLINS